MPQNYFGLYFNKSGNSLENSLLLSMHVRLYLPAASFASWLSLPWMYFAYKYAFLDILHLSSNQGASCLPHLFGFFGVLNSILFITLAATASSIKNYSTCAALYSLEIDFLSTIAWNFA